MCDVPEGYKMSEVGVIPVEWAVKSLDDIGSFKKGKNIPKKDLTSGGVPCVLYGEIYTKYNFTSKKLSSFIPLAIAQQSTSINKGDILFAGSGETADEIGKCFTYLGDEKACAGGDINILSPFNDDSTFLGYLLNSPQVNKQKSNLGQGSSVVHIYSSSLKTILTPLPPLPEQQAIASALSDVDALITALEHLITKKRNIKQGAMQQLLTGEKRLPGFEGEWEVKKLRDIASGVASGKSKSKSGMGTYPIYGSTGIIGRYDFYDYEGKKILVARVGANAGTINLVEGKYCVSDNTLIIQFNQNMDILFFYYHLSNYKLNTLVFGSGQPLITGSQLKDLTIFLPHLSEQQAIAQILGDMDAEIEALEQKQAKYKAIKQGMMQELLTGKTRLV